MFQSQSYKLDESQVIECQRTNEMLDYELEVLTAYQNKNKKQAQEQRDRERKELENRVAVRRSVLESKVGHDSYLFAYVVIYSGNVSWAFFSYRWMLNYNNSIKNVLKD